MNLQRLTTLGHPGRIAVFRLLMRHYPSAVTAGSIAAATGFKASTLSVYLSALTSAELVSQRREGTSRLYRIRMDALQGLQDYLFRDCCRGRPELCPPVPGAAIADETKAYSVLFVCTGNSARSIMAEALLRELGGARFIAHSAGTNPRPAPNPLALEMLRANGHGTAGYASKGVAQLRSKTFDFVFTVCDRAADEDCPPWPGQPIGAHWSVADPSRGDGPAAFEQAYHTLRARIARLAVLPVSTLDAVALQAAIDEISKEPHDDIRA